MAKYYAGILSPFRNKVGNVVGRKWRGIDVMSAYNKNVSNPRTNAQQSQRARLSACSSLARTLNLALMLGYTEFCKGKPQFPRAMFVKDNIKAVHAPTPDSVAIDYSDLIIARGNALAVLPGAPEFDQPLTVEFTSDASNIQALAGYAAGDFSVYGVVYCPDYKQAIVSAPVSIGTTGDAIMDIVVPGSWNGIKVHVYCFTVANVDKYESLGITKGEASDSIYVGQGNIG